MSAARALQRRSHGLYSELDFLKSLRGLFIPEERTLTVSEELKSGLRRITGSREDTKRFKSSLYSSGKKTSRWDLTTKWLQEERAPAISCGSVRKRELRADRDSGRKIKKKK